MASGDTKTEAMLNALANGGGSEQFRGCCNTKTQNYILGAIDRIQAVEDEVERIENNPDVVDIVATYQDLEGYDTSTLTDKDIIRVLSDETHNGESTYYRYDKATDSWEYIGSTGPSGGDAVKTLTSADYNWPADNPTRVALWLLPTGLYTWDTNFPVSPVGNFYDLTAGIALVEQTPDGQRANRRVVYLTANDKNLYDKVSSDGRTYDNLSLITYVRDSLTSTSTTSALSANQGKVLNDKITALEARVAALEGN